MGLLVTRSNAPLINLQRENEAGLQTLLQEVKRCIAMAQEHNQTSKSQATTKSDQDATPEQNSIAFHVRKQRKIIIFRPRGSVYKCFAITGRV